MRLKFREEHLLLLDGIQAVNIALAEKYNYEKCSYDDKAT